MPTGTVTERGEFKGKKFIKIDGDKYSAGKTDLGGLMVGDKIEFESNSWEYQGKTYWGINGWKLLEGTQKYPQQPPQSNGQAAPAPSLGVPVNRLGAPVEDSERPAISNWIAAAIAAGKIESCVDILPWVRAAKAALREDEQFQTDKDIKF